MSEWLPHLPQVWVSLEAKQITGCGLVILVIFPCSVFMQMRMENQLPIMRKMFL